MIVFSSVILGARAMSSIYFGLRLRKRQYKNAKKTSLVGLRLLTNPVERSEAPLPGKGGLRANL
ncbi:hypothetical protein [Pseudogulbenkiania sp. NH8B]|uniref:hypothetical protein n=1 Tax=Pseudogulbenkiania sp. (strain NH8B) TaxID=748280 RepID=UPI0011D249A2|nr:hypothetical protein [Pseudogulbenkiania sp. NH8B]